MSEKRDPRRQPKAGDRLRNEFGDEYEVTVVDRGYVHDICTKGVDAGQGELSNPISQWLTFMYRAEVLHAAD